MPTYLFACPGCEAGWEVERPVARAADPAACPACGAAGRRVYTTPRLLLKGDPLDNRPVWHTHDGYGHSHAPRRGRHANPADDH